MQHKYDMQGTRMIYYMPREVDQHVTGQIRDFLEQMILLDGVRTMILDFSETDFMDSSGIGVYVGRKNTMRYLGGTVNVSHMNKRIHMVFEKAGLLEGEENGRR